jgi:acyl carrier protein
MKELTTKVNWKELTTKVNSIIVEQLGVEDGSLVPEANLLDDLGADSLDVVELVMALEEEFKIEVPDEDVENIRTIGDIVRYVGTKVEANA